MNINEVDAIAQSIFERAGCTESETLIALQDAISEILRDADCLYENDEA